MNNPKIPKEFIPFQKVLGESIVEEYGIYHLNIEPHLGSGNIDCVNFDPHILALDINYNAKVDTTIELEFSHNNPLLFIYSSQGCCSFRFNVDEKENIENLKSTILKPNSNGKNLLIFEGGITTKINIIIIDQDKYFEKFLNGYYHTDIKMENLLRSLNAIEFLHKGSFNYKITEQLRLLKSEKKSHTITDFLYLEGIYHLVMAYHIEQFNDDLQREESYTSLTEHEIKGLTNLSNYIISLPELQHTIDDLCRRAGMSPAKLQEGFKYLHGKTVLNYIRYVRIQKAETLLLNSDLNISEIVYSIGFTSRSYFCKIFRAKYGCTPKEYRRSIHKKLMRTVA